MARKGPDEKVTKAYELFKQGLKLVEIASQLNVPEGTVRSWKNRNKWGTDDNATLHNSKCNVAKKKKGGQPGNKNATGPPGNRHAEKHGFFAKWLPEETMQIMGAIKDSNPVELLWDNIQLQYTAIIRAQKLMYVKDQEDITTTKIGEGYSDSGSSEKWEVQYAWDKHATFLNAQSRAMKTLEGMIKQYEELMKSDLATEEQKERINKLRAEVAKITENENDNSTENDGFIEALQGKVDEVWQE